MTTSYANPYTLAADAAPSDRAAFIRSTYTHLGIAILAFIGVEWFLLQQSWTPMLIEKMMGFGWLLVMGLFMGVSFIADRLARSETSKGVQYGGLGLFIVAEAFVFLPLLYFAAFKSGEGALLFTKAGITTGAIFAALTATAFITRKDFSFLRSILVFGGFIALGLIVCSILFGFTLGTIFAGAMALFAGVAILYSTSNIIHHYRTDQSVSAALSLFSSVALLFYYILQLFMSRD
ncbi:MAG: Bax inhibitor-1 family protein [Verrucomicrobiales bacterium]|nr:Bax inhibitor-1 family protein [Verrucomicrobiales bacterium]